MLEIAVFSTKNLIINDSVNFLNFTVVAKLFSIISCKFSIYRLRFSYFIIQRIWLQFFLDTLFKSV